MQSASENTYSLWLATSIYWSAFLTNSSIPTTWASLVFWNLCWSDLPSGNAEDKRDVSSFSLIVITSSCQECTNIQKEITCTTVLYLVWYVHILKVWLCCAPHCGNAEDKDHCSCTSFVVLHIWTKNGTVRWPTRNSGWKETQAGYKEQFHCKIIAAYISSIFWKNHLTLSPSSPQL